MASTISDETTVDRAIARATTRKMLIAMYGQETLGWVREVARTASRPDSVRLVVVDEGRAPAFTSLLPSARRRFGAALAAWRRELEDRQQAVLDALLPHLPASAEVVRVRSGADAGQAIAACANAWPADVVLVAHDCRDRAERALTRRVHECVVRLARCAVLVIAADPLANAPGRIVRLPLRWRSAARGGA